MRLLRLSVCISLLSALAQLAHSYEFSSVKRTTKPSIADPEPNTSTGLSTTEESRIYGGSEADVRQHPYSASLRFDPHGKTFCGGTLVATQYILTAGHCIKTDKGQVYASLGSEFGSGAGSRSSEVIKVTQGFQHHLYDVGLLKLKKPVKRKMAKLCAADGSDNKVGTMGTVLGWGKTETSGELGSPILRQLTVPVISNAECAKFKKYVGRVTDGMLCAGTGNTCNGDSGGPLIVDDDIIIGCVSWGSKCGEQAGIYTRLTYVMDYI
ncbi:hypothetical protein PHYSODRAFT_470322, partial [Phytophthora sojae]